MVQLVYHSALPGVSRLQQFRHFGGRRKKYQMLVCVLYTHGDLDDGLCSFVSQRSLSVVATLSSRIDMLSTDVR